MKIKRTIRKVVNSLGYDIVRYESRTRLEDMSFEKVYIERPEYGPSNIETKMKLADGGGEFHPASIVHLNHVVASYVKSERRVIELGSGTGYFAHKLAELRPECDILACEFDRATVEWVMANREIPQNVKWIKGPLPDEEQYADLSVAIEVVEHLSNFSEFLSYMGMLAPRSVITTPNRKRAGQASDHFGPPFYFKHVREWNVGEFYWVLRSFWQDVDIFTIPSITNDEIRRVCVDSICNDMIAFCEGPIGSQT